MDDTPVKLSPTGRFPTVPEFQFLSAPAKSGMKTFVLTDVDFRAMEFRVLVAFACSPRLFDTVSSSKAEAETCR